MDKAIYIIGQILGGVAIILGFISFQMKTQKKLLIMQTLATLVFCFHYFMIGAMTGMAMNAVNIVRNFVYNYRNQNDKKGWLVPSLFALVIGIMGVITWDAWYSAFMVVGIVINTLAMAIPDPQKVRKSILITSPIVIVYNCMTFSMGGTIYEAVVITSSVIGLYRNKNKYPK